MFVAVRKARITVFTSNLPNVKALGTHAFTRIDTGPAGFVWKKPGHAHIDTEAAGSFHDSYRSDAQGFALPSRVIPLNKCPPEAKT
jgi:hypothetical protein